jgi:hypothetical protein
MDEPTIHVWNHVYEPVTGLFVRYSVWDFLGVEEVELEECDLEQVRLRLQLLGKSRDYVEIASNLLVHAYQSDAASDGGLSR